MTKVNIDGFNKIPTFQFGLILLSIEPPHVSCRMFFSNADAKKAQPR